MKSTVCLLVTNEVFSGLIFLYKIKQAGKLLDRLRLTEVLAWEYTSEIRDGLVREQG